MLLIMQFHDILLFGYAERNTPLELYSKKPLCQGLRALGSDNNITAVI